jgi:hypothetical protein
MDMTPVLAFLNEVFLSKLEYNITYVSMLFILSFYAAPIVKHSLKTLDLSFVTKFILFSVFLILGTNPLFTFLTNSVLSIENVQLRWTIIIGLLIWSFIEFDDFIEKK